jgi:hypothetical protein
VVGEFRKPADHNIGRGVGYGIGRAGVPLPPTAPASSLGAARRPTREANYAKGQDQSAGDEMNRGAGAAGRTSPAPGIASEHHERRLERLIDRLPERLQKAIRWLRRPGLRWVRLVAGVLFIAGSFLSILPIFGIWMLPVGLVLLAEDIPALRRLRDRVLDWIVRHRPHWLGADSAASGSGGRQGPPCRRGGRGCRRRNDVAGDGHGREMRLERGLPRHQPTVVEFARDSPLEGDDSNLRYGLIGSPVLMAQRPLICRWHHAQPLEKAFLRPHGSSISASRTPGMEYGTPG